MPRKKGAPTNEQNDAVLPKILDGKYFGLVEFTEYPNLLAACVECKVERSAALNGTGNLTKHYREAHPEQYDKLLDYISRAHPEKNIISKTSRSEDVMK